MSSGIYFLFFASYLFISFRLLEQFFHPIYDLHVIMVFIQILNPNGTISFSMPLKKRRLLIRNTSVIYPYITHLIP